MKKSLIIAGVLAVLGTPAFAQSFDPDMGTGNNVPFAYAQQTAYAHQSKDSANAAFAQADTKSTDTAPDAESYNEGHGNLGGSVNNGDVVDGY
jgi:hypothetical protein